MRNPIFLLLTVLLCTPVVTAQNLKRRPFLGVQVAPLTDSVAAAKNVPSAKGAIVMAVIPNSTAASLKLQPQDVLVSINGKEVTNAQEVVATAKAFTADEKVSINLYRNGKRMQVKGKVKPMPYETDPKADVIYDEVALENNGYARAIMKKPKGKGRFPAVFFIQGFSCYSLDNMPEHDTQRRLIDGLVAKGYAVFRMEKPGMGDAKGTKPCAEIGYNEELAAFAAGLKKLKTYDFVDKDNVFLFGHSLGATTAPLIAMENKVKGIITYGSTGKPWLEYMIELGREQRPIAGIDYVQVDEDMKTSLPMLYELMVLKKTPQQLAENPKYKAYLEQNYEYDGKGHLFGRHYTYLQELHDVPVNRAWKEANAYTLSLFGEADVQAIDEDGAKIIADVVNSYYPGKAEYKLVPRTDHTFAESGTQKEYLRMQNEGTYDAFAATHFNQKLVDMLDEWMKDKLKR
ncbi:PDZ domain-containing protein [Pontibacter sp. KCTC 32443]|uniref:alpha/beta hydrolase family protein n=1 Tax=Pontibacter TaxID=323449 RepID=UPI00164DB5B0|nr:MULTISPECIES: alpha/beta fold hydrolase [Pontibacter]MBC5774923.1 PDZ domain-containing protein [Pontibacter sp. KCTC 32443]